MSASRSEVDHAAILRFGIELNRLRSLSGLSQGQLGRRIGTSGQQVGAVERGDRKPSRRLAELADAQLGANGSLLALWPGVRQTYPRWLEAFVELEAKAQFIHEFQVQAFPGLLQTEEYARAVLNASWPPLSIKKTTRLLEGRIARQEILTGSDAPMLWAVIDEGVFRRPVGGVDVQRFQLKHLMEMGGRPNIRLQVLPFDKGAHAAMDGSFVVLEMSQAESLAYAEIPGSGHVITDLPVVADCTRRFGALRGMALSPDDTLEYMATLLGDEA